MEIKKKKEKSKKYRKRRFEDKNCPRKWGTYSSYCTVARKEKKP